MSWLGSPPRAVMIARSFGTRASSWIGASWRKTWPSTLTVTASGALACLCGKSIGTPTVSSGADTMKTINSTSMTSTNGVTLISCMTARRRPLRLPVETAPTTLAAITPSPALVDLPRQDRRELVGKTFQPLGLPVHLGRELIIENRRRNGGNEADCGRKQRFRDTRRDHRERGVLRRRDRLEAGQDAGDGAEQADKGTGRADGCQHQKPALHILDFAGD